MNVCGLFSLLIKVVIAGSGMIGNSVAYHLVQRGWSDIVIIDKGW